MFWPGRSQCVPPPQRMSWSPMKTPRLSFCPVRASRWIWKQIAWMTASTSTSSTSATSCGACAANPVLGVGRPSQSTSRYLGPTQGLAAALGSSWSPGCRRLGTPLWFSHHVGPLLSAHQYLNSFSLSPASRAHTTPPRKGTQRARAARWFPGEPVKPARCALFLPQGLPEHRALREGRAAGAPRLAPCMQTPRACSRLPAPHSASSPLSPTGQSLVAPVGKRSWKGGRTDKVAPGGQLQKVRACTPALLAPGLIPFGSFHQ